MTDCKTQRWYDAEIARMMLETANSNFAARPADRPQDAYRLTVAAMTGAVILAALNLFL